MISRMAKWSSTIIISLLLAACANQVPRIDLAPQAMAKVKTIAIIRPPEPKVYSVVNFGHPGIMFGLIGGMIVVADRNDKQEQLAKTYHEQHVEVCNQLSRKISDRLASLGFSTRVEDAPWVETNGIPVILFKDIKTDADAVLVVAPSVIGFVATGLGRGYDNDYLPTIATSVILLGNDREKPLYRGYHATGWEQFGSGWRFTPPTTTFPDFDSLYTDPKASYRSLVEAADKIATSVVMDLRQQQQADVTHLVQATASEGAK